MKVKVSKLCILSFQRQDDSPCVAIKSYFFLLNNIFVHDLGNQNAIGKSSASCSRKNNLPTNLFSRRVNDAKFAHRATKRSNSRSQKLWGENKRQEHERQIQWKNHFSKKNPGKKCGSHHITSVRDNTSQLRRIVPDAVCGCRPLACEKGITKISNLNYLIEPMLHRTGQVRKLCLFASKNFLCCSYKIWRLVKLPLIHVFHPLFCFEFIQWFQHLTCSKPSHPQNSFW